MNKIQVTLSVGDNKIQAIKTLRQATGWGLKEAKDAVDAVCNRAAPAASYGAVVHMDPAHFGRVVALTSDADYGGLAWSQPSIVDAPTVIDLTRPVSSPYVTA